MKTRTVMRRMVKRMGGYGVEDVLSTSREDLLHLLCSIPECEERVCMLC
jgi:hypothetical protein